jgi:hypothetical protein
MELMILVQRRTQVGGSIHISAQSQFIHTSNCDNSTRLALDKSSITAMSETSAVGSQSLKLRSRSMTYHKRKRSRSCGIEGRRRKRFKLGTRSWKQLLPAELVMLVAGHLDQGGRLRLMKMLKPYQAMFEPLPLVLNEPEQDRPAIVPTDEQGQLLEQRQNDMTDKLSTITGPL